MTTRMVNKPVVKSTVTLAINAGVSILQQNIKPHQLDNVLHKVIQKQLSH